MTETGGTRDARARSCFRAGFATALAASFFTSWTTVVRDDGNGVGHLMLVLAAGVGAFTALCGQQVWLEP